MDQVKEFQDNTKSTMSAVGDIMTSTGKTMTKAVTLPILGLTTAAVKVGGDFEEQMSRVKAISGATGDAFEELRDQAIDLGAKTAFSAKESADGMENLASAGFDAQEIMAAMPGLLDLAAVSGGDVALASENAATALRGFGLEADQSGHIADVFARAAADTNAEVADMGEAMKYIAPVANAMGLSIEETAAAIGIMSDAGVKGSQAGTTLRGALSRISKPTKAMRETMDELGISFYDSEGNMISLQDQIGVLSNSFEGMTQEQKNQALVTLYGQESLSGMMALIDKGPDSLGALTESLEQSDGAADEMARTMQDNMNSSIEQMMGALESAAIVIQDILAPAISAVADYIGGLAEKFVSAPKWMQTAIISLGLFAAAVGPILFGVGKLMKLFQTVKVGILALKSGFAVFNTVVSAVGGGLKAVFAVIAANPIILLIAAIVAAVAAFIYFWNTSEEFRNFFIGIWEAIKEAVGVAIEWIKDSWASMVEGAKNAVESVKQAWADTKQWFADLWQGIADATSKAWNAIKEAPGKTADWIMNKWNDTKKFFADIWSNIKNAASDAWDSVVNVLSPYVETITGLFEPLVTFFSNLWSQIGEIAGAAWEVIKTIVMGPILLLIDLVLGNFEQLKTDAATLWTTLTENIQIIISTFIDIVVGYYTALKDTVINIWTAISTTIQTLWASFTTWISETTKAIADGIVQAWQDFRQSVIDLFNATVQGAKDTWQAFKEWFKNLIDTTVQNAKQTWENFKQSTIDIFNSLVEGAKKTWENLKQGTIDIFNGLVDGAKQAWENLVESVTGLIDDVTGWFNKLKDINLLDIGKAIMDGFLKGLKEKYEGVKDFIGGIGDWIRDHKGPIRVDKKLLIPAGNAIMEGLNNGLDNGFGAVQDNVSSMGDRLSTNFDIGSRLTSINSQIQTKVQHEVSYGTNSKPAQFNVRIGNSEFSAFLDDISQAQGNEINLNMQF